jgi:hypothetical protein
MNDIITYDYNIFLEIKDKVNYSNINKELIERINLLNDYDCFKNKFCNWSKKNHIKKETNYKKPIIKKTENKELISYLNKITKKNYDDLSIKVVNNITDDNYKMIIDKLFEISYKQPNYYKLYVKLYKLIKFYGYNCEDNLQNNIKDYLNTKINEIIDNKNNDFNLIIKHINKNDLNYDDFCDINKNAKHLKGKVLIICQLIKNEIISLNKNDFILNLIKYKNYENEIYLELLQIINNILKLNENETNILKNYLNNNNFKGKMMIKFKLQDIISNKPIKEF